MKNGEGDLIKLPDSEDFIPLDVDLPPELTLFARILWLYAKPKVIKDLAAFTAKYPLEFSALGRLAKAGRAAEPLLLAFEDMQRFVRFQRVLETFQHSKLKTSIISWKGRGVQRTGLGIWAKSEKNLRPFYVGPVNVSRELHRETGFTFLIEPGLEAEATSLVADAIRKWREPMSGKAWYVRLQKMHPDRFPEISVGVERVEIKPEPLLVQKRQPFFHTRLAVPRILKDPRMTFRSWKKGTIGKIRTVTDFLEGWSFAQFLQGKNPGFIAHMFIRAPIPALMVATFINRWFRRRKRKKMQRALAAAYHDTRKKMEGELEEWKEEVRIRERAHLKARARAKERRDLKSRLAVRTAMALRYGGR